MVELAMFIITGANGFIGSVLVWELNQAGIEDITCVDAVSLKNRPGPLKNRKYSQFFMHNQLFSELENSDFSRRIKCIFHLGACSDTTEMDVQFLKENNTEYTNNLFTFCTRNNIPFIYASSGAIYGDGHQGFDDSTPSTQFSPLNPYGQSKLNSDIWCEKQSSTPPRWYGLRFFNVYGPNEYHKKEMRSLVHKAYNQILETGRLKLFRSHRPDYQDGQQKRDFVYVKDITRWMLELYQTESITSGIYNLGFGSARTWIDLATAVFDNLNIPLNIDWMDIPENIRHQYQYFTEANINKLKEQKLSPPQWPLEKGVKDYISLLKRENPFL